MKSTEISPRVADGRFYTAPCGISTKNHRKDTLPFICETLLYLKAFGWYEVLVTLVHDSF